jgi:hypothetical protein
VGCHEVGRASLALYRGHNKKTERRHQELVSALKKP